MIYVRANKICVRMVLVAAWGAAGAVMS